MVPTNEQKGRSKSRKVLTALIVLSLLAFSSVIVGAVWLLPQVDVVYKHLWYKEAAANYKASGLPWEASDFRKEPDAKAVSNFNELLDLSAQVHRKKPPASISSDFLLTSQTLPIARKHLKTQEEKLAQIAILLSQPVQFPGDPDMGVNLLYPHLTFFKSTARAYLLRAELNAKEGNIEGSLEDIKLAAHIASVTEEYPALITTLAGISIRALIHRSILKCATYRMTDDTALKGLISLVHSLPSKQGFSDTLKGEAYQVLSTLRNLHIQFQEIEREHYKELVPSSPLKESGDLPSQRTQSYAVSLLNGFADIFNISKGADRLIDQRIKIKGVSDRVNSDRSSSSLMAQILFPVFEQYVDAYIRDEAERVAVKSVLEIAYERQNGWSGEKNRLTVSLPMDPFLVSEREDQLRLKLKGMTISVYSVGLNQLDDGGIRTDVSVAQEKARAKAEGREAKIGTLVNDIVAQIPWTSPLPKQP